MTKNLKKILVSVLIILLGAMLCVAGVIAANVGGGGVDGGKKEKQICSIYNSYETIRVNAYSDDVIVRVADVAGPRVMAYEQQKVNITARSKEAGVLEVDREDTRAWFEKLTFLEKDIPIIIYISSSVSVNLQIVTDGGNVTVEQGVRCGDVSVTSKSGNINLLAVPTGNVSLTTMGKITKQ